MTSKIPQESMFSPEDSHARTTQLQERAADWLATVALSGGSFTASLWSNAPHGLSERMCPDSSLVEAAQILRRSSGRSPNAGMAWPGQYLTLNTSEWRNDAAVCSLSDILEENPDPKFSLSQKACLGILRRAEKRGKELPRTLAARTRGGGWPGTDEALDGAVVASSLTAAHKYDPSAGRRNEDDVNLVAAFVENQRGETWEAPIAQAVNSGGGKPGQGYAAARVGASVRRLTPLECERLQGFPDGWTDIPGNSDTQRYRQLGNAVAVPVAEWIMERIAAA